MDSLEIRNWENLEHFGIKALTGEACNYMMRILCDVNEEGRRGMLEYFSLPAGTVLAAPWNSQVNGQPSVGSLMLHRDGLPALAEFLLRRAGAKALVRTPNAGAIVGIFTDARVQAYEKLVAQWPDTTRAWQIQHLPQNTHPCIGSRNIHAATGRAL